MNGKLGIKYTRQNHWNRYDYTLLEDFVVWIPESAIPQHLRGFSRFENEWLLIEWAYGAGGDADKLGIRITVRKGYAWDGATAVPDKGAVEGSCVHDPMYQFAVAIAAATGWTIRETLDFADHCFLAVMRQARCKVSRLYFNGVQLLGNAFWHIAHFREWIGGKRTEDGQVTNGRR